MPRRIVERGHRTINWPASNGGGETWNDPFPACAGRFAIERARCCLDAAVTLTNRAHNLLEIRERIIAAIDTIHDNIFWWINPVNYDIIDEYTATCKAIIREIDVVNERAHALTNQPRVDETSPYTLTHDAIEGSRVAWETIATRATNATPAAFARTIVPALRAILAARPDAREPWSLLRTLAASGARHIATGLVILAQAGHADAITILADGAVSHHHFHGPLFLLGLESNPIGRITIQILSQRCETTSEILPCVILQDLATKSGPHRTDALAGLGRAALAAESALAALRQIAQRTTDEATVDTAMASLAAAAFGRHEKAALAHLQNLAALPTAAGAQAIQALWAIAIGHDTAAAWASGTLTILAKEGNDEALSAIDSAATQSRDAFEYLVVLAEEGHLGATHRVRQLLRRHRHLHGHDTRDWQLLLGDPALLRQLARQPVWTAQERAMVRTLFKSSPPAPQRQFVRMMRDRPLLLLNEADACLTEDPATALALLTALLPTEPRAVLLLDRLATQSSAVRSRARHVLRTIQDIRLRWDEKPFANRARDVLQHWREKPTAPER
ncbi:MAG: hypothetical protein HY543_00410 [Deltaproteobacteria bacterium]|nr:hypothetical protein [Deltaproteobacteria bacterium]